MDETTRWESEMTDIVERLQVTEADGRKLPLHELRCEAAAEIERLRGAYEQERKDCLNLTEKVIPNLRAEIERLRQQVTQRGARMQVMREWMDSGSEVMGPDDWPVWYVFLNDHPKAAKWFDKNGVPK